MELAKLPQIELRMSTFRYKYAIPESLEDAFSVVNVKKAAVDEVRPRDCSICHPKNHPQQILNTSIHGYPAVQHRVNRGVTVY